MPSLPTTWKDWVDMCVTAGGVIGALIVFSKNSVTASQELRRKRAEAGKSLITEMCEDGQVVNAFTLLDMADGEVVTLKEKDEPDIKATWDQAMEALSAKCSLSAEMRVRITDAFDALFYYFALFDHCIESGLVQLKDVAYPASYYIRILGEYKSPFVEYLKRNRLSQAEDFLARWSEEWATK